MILRIKRAGVFFRTTHQKKKTQNENIGTTFNELMGLPKRRKNLFFPFLFAPVKCRWLLYVNYRSLCFSFLLSRPGEIFQRLYIHSFLMKLVFIRYVINRLVLYKLLLEPGHQWNSFQGWDLRFSFNADYYLYCSNEILQPHKKKF